MLTDAELTRKENRSAARIVLPTMRSADRKALVASQRWDECFVCGGYSHDPRGCTWYDLHIHTHCEPPVGASIACNARIHEIADVMRAISPRHRFPARDVLLRAVWVIRQRTGAPPGSSALLWEPPPLSEQWRYHA